MTIKYSKGTVLVCVEAGQNSLSYGGEYTVAEDFDSNIHGEVQIVSNDEGKSNGYYAYRFQPLRKQIMQFTSPVIPPVKKNISYSLDHDDGMINIRISGELTTEQMLAILAVVQ